ncbi:hypothetical protein B0H14DRAFT_2996824 [Mycena olivaceomarginata]|nr:hypothetical protein B0H14DRAFT_2996824 [Mycena olivaceomarginata]
MFISSVLVLALTTDLGGTPEQTGSCLPSGGSSPSDLGEPLNVIISGLSSPAVLTDNGFLNFARAIGLSVWRWATIPNEIQCQVGGPQTANLGDGNGYVNQTVELRQDYGDVLLGTCLESLIGGNHLRVYRQNGPTANTGALFLAGATQNVVEGHTISPDGYNVGRDLLVQNATNTNPLPSFGGVTYSAALQQRTDLLPAGANGVNHDIATDGVTSLLTVTIV